MGEGLDKIARSLLDLEPTAILDLFLVFPDYVKKPETSYAIHNGSNFKKGIVWQGRDYMPVALEIEGFEINADGRVNRPKMKISNKDYFMTNLLRRDDDFKNARITRIRTLVKFLDDENFDGGNPFGDSDPTAELSRQDYIVSQKAQENKIYVELELTSPLDLDNFEINSRRVMGKYCYWQYRGMGCQYQGVPVQKEDGRVFKDINGNQISINEDFSFGSSQNEYDNSKDYTTGDLVFIKNNRVTIEDPGVGVSSRPLLNYYIAKTDVRGLSPDENPQFWDQDGCNKKLSSCKLRFTEERSVTRFLSEEQATVKTLGLVDYNNNKDLLSFYEPENELPFLETLSGNGSWTMCFNFNDDLIGSRNNGALLNTSTYRWDSNRGLTLVYNLKKIKAYLRSYGGGKISKSIRVTPEDQNQNKLVMRKGEDGYNFTLYNPSTKVETTPDRRLTGYNYEHFRVFSHQNRLRGASEGVCFWDRYLENEEIDLLYRPVVGGGSRMKPIDYFKESEIPEERAILNGLLAWWTDASSNENGFIRKIVDLSDQKNDLIYSGPDHEAELINTYRFPISKNVTSQEEISYLPFGGFPGTDGFDFQR
jgi:lambda family phage minor tail protein L